MVSARTRARLAAARALLETPPPEPTPGQLTVPTGPRIGSVCSGYGGLDEAVLSVLGGSLAWVADPDDGPSRILAHHYPDTPNHGDITALDWAAVEPVDVLIGGYPCQPFSVAGQRKGTADDRHIWPHIAAAIRVLRPRLCLFENVTGHVRLGLDAVLADLAALGFDAEWMVVRASDVGAAHQRARVFLLAWPAADAPHLGHEWSRDARHGWPRSADHRVTAADADRAERGRQPLEQPRGNPAAGHRRPAADTSRHGHRDTGPARVGGVPATPVASGAASVPDADRSRRGPHQRDIQPRQSDADWGRFALAIARWEAATGRRAPWATDARGRLAPEFVEWLMGLTPGWVTAVPGLSRTQQLKALGNGVVPPQAAYALRLLLDRAGLAHLFRLAA